MVEGGRRLRVGFDAHTVGRQQTGNERYAVELARALAAVPDVDVIAYLDGGAAWPATGGASSAPALSLHRLRLRNRWLRISTELPYRARRDHLDLLHVQYVPPPFTSVPVATLVADLSFIDRPDLLARSSRVRLRLTTRLAAARSAAILVPSSFTRDRLLACYDVDPARVHVTPEGVSPRWSGPESGADLPADLPARFVLAIGALHPRKNLPRVIQAVAQARSDGAGELSLVLVGPDGPGAQEVQRTIDSLGAQAWVRQLGFVGDRSVAALYSRAVAVVHASLYEGFGLPVLEAMAAGAAVVASNTTSMPEVAGDAALLVDPTDVAAIAQAIGRIATDPALRERLVATGRQRAAVFTWERCALATVAAYRAALAT
jgi:glycosyltransferase involved in cell wall biosynthesis